MHASHRATIVAAALVAAACAACTVYEEAPSTEPTWPGGGQTPTTTTPDAGSSWTSDSGTPNTTWDADTGWDAGNVADAGPTDPRSLFEALLPTFESTCGPCHVQGSSNAPPYLGGSDPYTTIKTYAGFVVANPLQSLLMTKGAHEGPALVNPLRQSIFAWLTAEAAGAPAGAVTTAPFAVNDGANTVDLSSLAPGASITFTASTSGDYLDMTNIVFAATTSAVTVTYPIFYIVPPTGSQIVDDDFSNVSQTIGAGQSATLGPGLLTLEGWATGDDLRIAFKQLVSAGSVSSDDAGAATPTPAACQAVGSFTQNAVPVIQENGCLNCHGTGGSGNGSLDLSGLAANPPDDTTACANALAKVDLADPTQSPIILAPTGGIAGHPFTTATSDYTPAMETWIAAE